MDKYDIIIFMGQSNMQGQSGATTNTDIVHNAYEYRFLTNKVKPLQTPVGEEIRYDMTEGFSYTDENQDEWRKITALGSALDDCTNMIPEFCKNYTLITGRKVVAVHAAKGATTISQWLPGSGGYFAVREKVRACYNHLTSQNIGKQFEVVYDYLDENGIKHSVKSQRHTRYYASTKGFVIQKEHLVTKRREVLVSGLPVILLNTLDDIPIEERNINYKYYYDEAYKIINPIMLRVAPKQKGDKRKGTVSGKVLLKKYNQQYLTLFDEDE